MLTILLLHGFPTSSHMFRNLIPALADKFHLIAPDYPGFNSSMPTVDEFQYTFDHPDRKQIHFTEWDLKDLAYTLWTTTNRISSGSKKP